MIPAPDRIDPSPASAFGRPCVPPAARILNDASRAIASSLALVEALSEPLRSRLKAPLVGPARFGSAREYRTWKATRRARPQTWRPLQWPLGIWLLLGLVVTLWVGSLVP